MGGKVCVFQTAMPNVGVGALKNREDPKIMDTPKETTALEVPGTSFYKTYAVDCSRVQMSVDLFLFPQGYMDIASLGIDKSGKKYSKIKIIIDTCPRFTGGSLYVYKGFSAAVSEDAVKFATDFHHWLGFDAGFLA